MEEVYNSGLEIEHEYFAMSARLEEEKAWKKLSSGPSPCVSPPCWGGLSEATPSTL